MARALSGGATLAVAGGLALFRAWAYFAASTAFLSATSFTAAALLVASAVSLGAFGWGGGAGAAQRSAQPWPIDTVCIPSCISHPPCPTLHPTLPQASTGLGARARGLASATPPRSPSTRRCWRCARS